MSEFEVREWLARDLSEIAHRLFAVHHHLSVLGWRFSPEHRGWLADILLILEGLAAGAGYEDAQVELLRQIVVERRLVGQVELGPSIRRDGVCERCGSPVPYDRECCSDCGSASVDRCGMTESEITRRRLP